MADQDAEILKAMERERANRIEGSVFDKIWYSPFGQKLQDILAAGVQQYGERKINPETIARLRQDQLNMYQSGMMRDRYGNYVYDPRLVRGEETFFNPRTALIMAVVGLVGFVGYQAFKGQKRRR